MNISEENIKSVFSSVIETNGFFLIDLVFRGNAGQKIIEVYIDGEKNISADDCALISRELNSEIENKNLIENSYRLDVSSPGVDRPLKYLKQFPKHVNRIFDIEFNQGDEIKKVTGKLNSVSGEELNFISKDGSEYFINFKNIKKAVVSIGLFSGGKKR
ncbi:MAG: hypothetical protein IPM56_18905 [Ignavibacteriales bacterium]|nr:MAG: hypothetical protein IPM56_18905 [Ignavibacteriales bacterium]